MDPNNTEQLVAHYLAPRHVLVLPASTLLVLFTLYGIYIVIFVLAIHVLTRHQDASKLYLWCTIALFFLNTIYVIAYTTQALREQFLDYEAARTRNWDHLMDDTFTDRMITASLMTWVIATDCMNAVADCTLIHQCYVVWDRKKWILYPLVATSVVINGVILGGDITAQSQYSVAGPGKANEVSNGAWVSAAVFNFTLTLLTAGRIWWISHGACKEMKKQDNSRYTTIVAIIIESGFLYSASLFIVYIIQMAEDGIPAPFNAGVIPNQFSCIAPTLLTVRVAYIKFTGTSSVYRGQKGSALAFASATVVRESHTDHRDLYGAPASDDKAIC